MMARLGRNCGFYPSGDEPTDVWGLFLAGTSSRAPLRIPPGTLVTTLVNGNLENDGTHFYVTLGGVRYVLSVAKLVTAKGDLLVASGSGTLARLAVGSDKQLLMADSAQVAGVKWANPSADSIVFSTTDRLLGRASAGVGAGEEIVCTGAGRALLDDIDNVAQRATLGLGNAAIKDVGTTAGTVAAGDDSRFHLRQHAIDSLEDHTGFGNCVTRNVGTGENDVAAGNHIHSQYLVAESGAATADVPVLAPDGITRRTLHFVNGQFTGYTDG